MWALHRKNIPAPRSLHTQWHGHLHHNNRCHSIVRPKILTPLDYFQTHRGNSGSCSLYLGCLWGLWHTSHQQTVQATCNLAKYSLLLKHPQQVLDVMFIALGWALTCCRSALAHGCLNGPPVFRWVISNEKWWLFCLGFLYFFFFNVFRLSVMLSLCDLCSYSAFCPLRKFHTCLCPSSFLFQSPLFNSVVPIHFFQLCILSNFRQKSCKYSTVSSPMPFTQFPYCYYL